MSNWTTGRAALAAVVEAQTETCFKVYREDPARILEDANNEAKISTGGYGTRQLEELVQNAVDAARSGGHRIEVVLDREALYVANDGAPFDERGIRAIMASDISSKGDEQVGRFGIGFKSVLAVSDRPRVYSNTVSFGFDKAVSAQQLRAAGFDSRVYPTMRTAVLLDATADFREDSVLSNLKEWATTIVVLPLRGPEAHRLLSARLDLFRDEFVLFSPHIERAALRNEHQVSIKEGKQLRGLGLSSEEWKLLLARQPAPTRTLTVTGLGASVCRVQMNNETADWSVARTTHVPSARARAEAAYAADRDVVEMTYAVCLSDSRYEIGQFWAYFPTADSTTLSGIVNAPWKLSDDRKHILRGTFNDELLTEVLPDLVSRAFRGFQGTERLAAVIDAMPARGQEPRSDADETINAPVFAHLQGEAVVPDGTGTLRVASELLWMGGDTLGSNTPVPLGWMEKWREAGGHLTRWVHPLVYTNGERRLKVHRLMSVTGRPQASAPKTVDTWLEDLVEGGSVTESARAIDLAAWVLQQASGLADLAAARAVAGSVSRARIVRLEDGSLKAATRGQVFVRVDGEDRIGVDFVDPDLVAVPGVKEGLSRLGVVLMDRTGQLHQLLARAQHPDVARRPETVWPEIWDILREIPQDTAISILRSDLDCKDYRDLMLRTRVKTASGRWVFPGRAFLAGDVVPADGSRDRDYLIDPSYHRDDAEILREIGAAEAPSRRHVEMPQEDWYRSYSDAVKDAFVAEQSGARPERDHLLLEGSDPLWPLQILVDMTPQARAAVTARIIAQGLPSNPTVRHRRNAGYGVKKVMTSEAWFLRRHGLLPTSFGLMRPHTVLAAGDDIDATVLPAYEASAKLASALGLLEDTTTITP